MNTTKQNTMALAILRLSGVDSMDFRDYDLALYPMRESTPVEVVYEGILSSESEGVVEAVREAMQTVIDSRSGDDANDCRRMASAIESVMKLAGVWSLYDRVAAVDVAYGVTMDWPSAGKYDAWVDDVWLGLMDYLSLKEWQRLRAIEYPNLLGTVDGMAADLADSIIRGNGIEKVEERIECLEESDPVRQSLERAIARARVAA